MLVQDSGSGQHQPSHNNQQIHTTWVRQLLVMWAAFILRHVQLLLLPPSASNPFHSHGNGPASRTLVSATADFRAQARASLLAGGHVTPACASLLSFFHALAGQLSPASLLCLPKTLCHPDSRVPCGVMLTLQSWQGQLFASVTVALLSRLPFASLYRLRLIEAATRTAGLPEQEGATDSLPHNWPYQSLGADILLQEFAAAVGAFVTLPGIHAWMNQTSPTTAGVAKEHDLVSPFMLALQHVGAIILASCLDSDKSERLTGSNHIVDNQRTASNSKLYVQLLKQRMVLRPFNQHATLFHVSVTSAAHLQSEGPQHVLQHSRLFYYPCFNSFQKPQLDQHWVSYK